MRNRAAAEQGAGPVGRSLAREAVVGTRLALPAVRERTARGLAEFEEGKRET